MSLKLENGIEVKYDERYGSPEELERAFLHSKESLERVLKRNKCHKEVNWEEYEKVLQGKDPEDLTLEPDINLVFLHLGIFALRRKGLLTFSDETMNPRLPLSVPGVDPANPVACFLWEADIKAYAKAVWASNKMNWYIYQIWKVITKKQLFG